MSDGATPVWTRWRDDGRWMSYDGERVRVTPYPGEEPPISVPVSAEWADNYARNTGHRHAARPPRARWQDDGTWAKR